MVFKTLSYLERTTGLTQHTSTLSSLPGLDIPGGRCKVSEIVYEDVHNGGEQDIVGVTPHLPCLKSRQTSYSFISEQVPVRRPLIVATQTSHLMVVETRGQEVGDDNDVSDATKSRRRDVSGPRRVCRGCRASRGLLHLVEE